MWLFYQESAYRLVLVGNVLKYTTFLHVCFRNVSEEYLREWNSKLVWILDFDRE